MTTPALPRRFMARQADDGTWGVWDTVINAARAGGHTRAQAEQHAADVELQFDAWGPRPARSVRPVRPAVPVDAANWQPAGLLDHWVRVRADQSRVPGFAWYGRIRTTPERICGYPPRSCGGPTLRSEAGPFRLRLSGRCVDVGLPLWDGEWPSPRRRPHEVRRSPPRCLLVKLKHQRTGLSAAQTTVVLTQRHAPS